MTASREVPTNCSQCDSEKLKQDKDVLDTWFSSGLWPFSVFGWPEETPDFCYYYPTSVMETGYDILFFWVARMVMGAIEFTGKVPFHTVYLHGMIRDEKGQKMSKTKNNVIDPLTVMDEYGTDALRLTLLMGSSPGNDMNVSVKKVEGNRNFANKVWNIGRFVINAVDKIPGKPKFSPIRTLADSWILSRMNATVDSVNKLFETYQFGEAARQIYDFCWNDFADWYIEVSKRQLAEGGDSGYYTTETLVRILDVILRLLHPFTPFVTEALWKKLKEASITKDITGWQKAWEDSLIIAQWPEKIKMDGWEESIVKDFELIQNLVRSIRNSRSEQKVEPNRNLSAWIVSADNHELLKSQKALLSDLARLDLEALHILKEKSPDLPEGLYNMVAGNEEYYLQIFEEQNQVGSEEKLRKELSEVEGQIRRLEKLLASPFTQKAPEKIVAAEREKLEAYRVSAEKLKGQLG